MNFESLIEDLESFYDKTMESDVQAAIPKSILKKLTHKKSPAFATPPPDPLPHPTLREARNRELALEHAQLIQQRKDVEASILATTEALLDFPPDLNADPAHPTQAESSRLKELLRSFQPTDYDSLIEERNIDGKCGYTLCPRPHRVEEIEARYRILRGSGEGAMGMKVVKREELERWCSEECGKRALYIRVQLSEVPAWERTGRSCENIQLYGDTDVPIMATTERDEALVAVISDLKKLAIERGEKSYGSAVSSTEVHVHEQGIPHHNQGDVFQEDELYESSRIFGSAGSYMTNIGGSHVRRSHREEQLRDSGDMMDTI